jgi:hypothetical protein
MVIVEPIEIKSDIDSKAAIFAEGIIDDHCIGCPEFKKALNKGNCICERVSLLIIAIARPDATELDMVAAWMTMQKASRETKK